MILSKSITCVGLGEILWDILPAGPRLGGAPANFTFHAMQAGLDATAVSCVGKDQRGDEALQILKDSGVKVVASRSDKITGYVKATIDERGVPCYDFAKDTAYDHMPMTDELRAIAANTKVCCFGTLAQRYKDGQTRKTVAAFLDAMPENSTKVFDINLRQDYYDLDVIQAGLERCNVFKCNDDELPVVCKLLGKAETLTAAAFYEQVLKGYGIEVFIYTCGEKGSDIFFKGEHSFVPTPKVEVADTVGAGDSFTATFIALMVQGVELKAAHQYAADVAAYVCTCNGAMPKLSDPLKEQLHTLVKQASND